MSNATKYFKRVEVFVQMKPDGSLRARVRQAAGGTGEYIYGTDLTSGCTMTYGTLQKDCLRALAAFTEVIEYIYDDSCKAGVKSAAMFTHNGRWVSLTGVPKYDS